MVPENPEAEGFPSLAGELDDRFEGWPVPVRGVHPQRRHVEPRRVVAPRALGQTVAPSHLGMVTRAGRIAEAPRSLARACEVRVDVAEDNPYASDRPQWFQPLHPHLVLERSLGNGGDTASDQER